MRNLTRRYQNRAQLSGDAGAGAVGAVTAEQDLFVAQGDKITKWSQNGQGVIISLKRKNTKQEEK